MREYINGQTGFYSRFMGRLRRQYHLSDKAGHAYLCDCCRGINLKRRHLACYRNVTSKKVIECSMPRLNLWAFTHKKEKLD